MNFPINLNGSILPVYEFANLYGRYNELNEEEKKAYDATIDYIINIGIKYFSMDNFIKNFGGYLNVLGLNEEMLQDLNQENVISLVRTKSAKTNSSAGYISSCILLLVLVNVGFIIAVTILGGR